MEAWLPCFPLEVVVLPGERLKLHIFEPRYKQLIQDCRQQALNFGIPALMGTKIPGVGSELRLIEVERTYDNGEMDIEAEAISIFRVLYYEDPYEDRMYGAAKITTNKTFGSAISEALNELFEAYNLKLDSPFDIPPEGLTDLQIAHRMMLTSSVKLKLLKAWDEEGVRAILSNEIKMTSALQNQAGSLEGALFLN
jgi:uncharacterized protein